MAINKRLNFILFLWLASRGVLFSIYSDNPPKLFSELYGPFLQSFITSPSIDPWTNWINSSGAPDAFPYGWPMVILFSIGQYLGTLFGSAWIGFISTLLFLDLATLILVTMYPQNTEGRNLFPATAYLISPLPVLSIFMEGSTDFLPMLLVALAFLALSLNKPALAGLSLGLAVGSKVILAILLVGALLYFVRSRNSLRATLVFCASLGLAVLLSMSPWFYSQAFRGAVNASDDATGPLTWGIPSTAGSLLLLPLAVFVVWFAIYQLKRMNANLLALALASPILVTASLPGAPLGWSLWVLPLVILLAAPLARRFRVLAILTVNTTSIIFIVTWLESNAVFVLSEIQQGFLLSGNLALAIVTTFLLWREHYTRSDFVRLRSRPALVLIAGDSGVGKDTLADGLTNVLGRDSTIYVSGDDYHRWDRGNGTWRHFTHLNPNANNLTRFFDDILTLTDGGEIRSGKYDHGVGRKLMSDTARGREFVIAAGLHGLMINDMNRQASLTVFLEMSNNLRTALKLERDTKIRGHQPEAVLRSIEERREDSLKYIEPQRGLADLVVTSSIIEETGPAELSRIEAKFESEPKVFDPLLLAELSITCGLEVSMSNLEDNRRIISVRGLATPTDLSTAFGRLEPRIANILGQPKSWSDGSPGIVQMVVMVYLGNALRRERLVK